MRNLEVAMRIFELTERDQGCDRRGSTLRSRKSHEIPEGSMRRLSPAATWSISIILALLFAAVGLSKLWGPSSARWSDRFLNWGYPVGFQYVVGGVEIISGLTLLVPRSRRPAAVSLTLVMAGAVGTHLIHSELPRIIAPLILGILAFLLFLSTPTVEDKRSTP